MTEETQNPPWPHSVINFKVWLGDHDPALFAEISGLDSVADSLPYRHDSQRIVPKRPSRSDLGTLTLHRGILTRDSKFWAWYDKTQQNIIEPRVVVIELVNDAGTSTMRWTINGAWPKKISGTDPKSDAFEMAVEKLEIVFETLTVSAL